MRGSAGSFISIDDAFDDEAALAPRCLIGRKPRVAPVESRSLGRSSSRSGFILLVHPCQRSSLGPSASRILDTLGGTSREAREPRADQAHEAARRVRDDRREERAPKADLRRARDEDRFDVDREGLGDRVVDDEIECTWNGRAWGPAACRELPRCRDRVPRRSRTPSPGKGSYPAREVNNAHRARRRRRSPARDKLAERFRSSMRSKSTSRCSESASA
jgi:hypothetical protein